MSEETASIMGAMGLVASRTAQHEYSRHTLQAAAGIQNSMHGVNVFTNWMSQDVHHAIKWAILLLYASLLVGPHTSKPMQSLIVRRNPLAVSRMSIYTTLSMPAPDMMVTVRRVSPRR